jgi:hypothetical protein
MGGRGSPRGGARGALEEPPHAVALLRRGFLRREELVSLQVGDLDFPHRQARVRAETAKNGAGRVVSFSTTTAKLLAAYQRHRRCLSAEAGPLFLSESLRNSGPSRCPRGCGTRWCAGSPRERALRVSPRTPAGTSGSRTWPEPEIGHPRDRPLRRPQEHQQSAALYVHLSGAEVAEKVTRTMAGFDRMAQEALE